MANLSNNKLKTNNTLFDNNDILFKKYLMKSNVFAEYGCGQSTYWVLKNTTAQILSVDTSIDWIKTIKQLKVYDDQKIKFNLKHDENFLFLYQFFLNHISLYQKF